MQKLSARALQVSPSAAMVLRAFKFQGTSWRPIVISRDPPQQVTCSPMLIEGYTTQPVSNSHGAKFTEIYIVTSALKDLSMRSPE